MYDVQNLIKMFVLFYKFIRCNCGFYLGTMFLHDITKTVYDSVFLLNKSAVEFLRNKAIFYDYNDYICLLFVFCKHHSTAWLS